MELITTHPVKKSDLGFHSNLFGGKLLAWIDASAAAYASQVCDTPRVVTVAIDKCVFKRPAKEGSLIKIYASVDKIGNTSITLNMEARAHNVYNGAQKIILSTLAYILIKDPSFAGLLKIHLSIATVTTLGESQTWDA